MLSAQEADALARGQMFKRIVRAAAALSGLYDDVSIGERVGVGRGAVAGWWTGSRPANETIFRLAEATGLSADELNHFLYDDGPPPNLPEASGPAGLREGVRRAEAPPTAPAPGRPVRSPERPPHDAGVGHG